ncbi:MAG: TolC family protein [Planctomycetes bacterium]|nr:TolC family protein [Planctomycetota bacterium]
MKAEKGLITAALCVGLLALSACSPERYRRSADKETYQILRQKGERVPGMRQDFTIEQEETAPLAGCPQCKPSGESAPDETETAAGTLPVLVSLDKALQIAATNSRAYQSKKESLYLSALGLSLTRHAYGAQWSGSLNAGYDNTDVGDEESISGGGRLALSRLLKTGARITASLSTDISRFLTDDPRKAASSLLQLGVTQPLLQGAGLATNEPLIQAERNLLYSIRDFVRFKRSFFVDVLSSYYGVLREKQILKNEKLNHESLALARDRAEWLAKAGELPEFEVDQTRQQELQARDRLQTTRRQYESRLDQFKMTLGLPTETLLALDEVELDRLKQEPENSLQLDMDRAVQIALARRLDLATARDDVDDAERQVKVAASDLLPGLDLSASISSDTEGDKSPTDFRVDRTDTSVGLELELPLDKKSERNTYRSKLIALDRARRALSEKRDRIVLEAKDAWREYQRAGRSYEIQKTSVSLAEKRVESTQMLLEAGDATTRDMLDAHTALVNAQNALARALVDYKVARLELARDMEVLSVGPKGKLEDNLDEY